MPTKVVDTILPTTMIGSYPKARWSTRYNLAGADILEWWKLEENWHAWWDATTACISDQELAGLDIVIDGQMHFDDYGGGIGSFVWYWYERLGGFTKAKLPNPLARAIEQGENPDMSQVAWMHNWGGTAVTGEVSQGIPGRLGEMYEAAVQLTEAAQGFGGRRAAEPHLPRRLQRSRLQVQLGPGTGRGPGADLQHRS
jgi:Cobalamin-independent synthase, Catalytic domain